MPKERAKRKLSAILSADIEGYSRLMSDNELATIRTLKNHREIISKLVREYGGRVVDSPGDNLLAEFSSAVDSTECAIKIQQDLEIENEKLPDSRKMRYRIGINLGEVIDEGERIYGDGINIAARIESLSEAGGVCVSRNVYDQIKNKIDVGFESLGKQELKNITDPIEVCRVDMGKSKDTSDLTPKKRIQGKKSDLPLPERASIAVLPFTNMSTFKDDEYLADGITDNIITALSRTSEMEVIAQNSAFTYKGKSVNIQDVGEELGVRYVLEGSIQRADQRVRINAQLIDAKKGHHLWAERYDREMTDIFALQDEITLKIMRALQAKLTSGDQVRLWEGSTKNLRAFEAYYQAVDEYFRHGNIPRAKQLCEEALSLDPNYIEAIVRLGWICMMDFWYGFSETPDLSREKAVELVNKALGLNNLIDLPHTLLGKILYSYRKYEEAIAEGERGIFLNPNGADACAHYACILTFSGMPEKALFWLDKAFRLNPMPPVFYYAYVGMSNNVLERYEEAIEAYKKGLNANPNYLYVRIGLTESNSLLGRNEEAQRAAAEVLKLHPGFSSEYHIKAMQYKDKDDEQRFLNALRKVGLK